VCRYNTVSDSAELREIRQLAAGPPAQLGSKTKCLNTGTVLSVVNRGVVRVLVLITIIIIPVQYRAMLSLGHDS